MDVTPDTGCPRGRSDVVFRPLDDSWVLFDPRAEQLHVLNLSAALIWAHLDGETSAAVIAETVGEAYHPPLTASQVEPDVRSALGRFRDAGLLDDASHP